MLLLYETTLGCATYHYWIGVWNIAQHVPPYLAALSCGGVATAIRVPISCSSDIINSLLSYLVIRPLDGGLRSLA